MVDARDIWHVIGGIEMDLQAANAKFTKLRAMLATIDLPQPQEHRCPCGISFRGSQPLAEHLYHAHDGPEPAHWVAAEQRAEEPVA